VRQFFLVTSRGCPFRCVFCSGHSLHGRNIRYADVDVLIKHVKYLVENYGMNILTIYDDQILFNKERAKQLFRELAQFNLRIECPNGLSVAFMDDELIKLMRNAGMDTVCLAIESGSAHMLNEVIHKPLRLEQVKPVVEMLHHNNIFAEGYFVVGIPGEQEEDRIETVRFIKEVGLDWANFNLATPLRGSELYQICKDKGYIDPNFRLGDLGMHDYVINAPGLNPADIKRKRYLMNLDVNFVNNRRMRVGDFKVAVLCFEDVIARYENHAFACYYLAKALRALNKDVQRTKEIMNKIDDIVKKDNAWKEYFDYFKIDYLTV
jgi:anaerobic magnesium-protoporphyrin IX monomethyl ester cyclase